MGDFSADAEAVEQLLVGRVLTVKRVRELNAKDSFYADRSCIRFIEGTV